MNKISRFSLLLFLSGPVHFLYAQKEKIDTAAFQKIRNAELNSSQIPMIAHYLTDVAGPRLTNSPGFNRAGKWAIETMKSWGLQNASFEPWGVFGKGWEAEEFSISMRSPYYGNIIGYPLPWSANTNGEIKAPVYRILEIELLDSAFLEKHRDEFKGKIVLITGSSTMHESDFKPFSTRYTDSELVRMPDVYVYNHQQIAFFLPFIKNQIAGKLRLKSYGALAIVSSKSTGRDGTVVVQNRAGYKINSPLMLPEAEISSEEGFRIRRLIETGQTVELALNIKGKFFTEDTKGYNVIAEIPGTDPVLKDEVVMLGAHLDSWTAATGATDNAAGCTIMMEAVRLLDSLNLKPKRTIRIALWSGEEQGVYGSYNYVKNHFGNGETGLFKPEQSKISAYFNLDAGTGKIRGVFSDGDTAIKYILEQWLKPFHDLGATAVTIRSTGSTDHVSFEWAGIPGIDFMQDPLDYESKTHHTNMDTYDYLQIDDMKQAAIIIASFVYQASMRTELMPRRKFQKTIFPFEGL
jgi:carboxypeptidase Q